MEKLKWNTHSDRPHKNIEEFIADGHRLADNAGVIDNWRAANPDLDAATKRLAMDTLPTLQSLADPDVMIPLGGQPYPLHEAFLLALRLGFYCAKTGDFPGAIPQSFIDAFKDEPK